jgi:hypothetical protein
VLKYAHILYILACHMQIDADPVQDLAYHLHADPDPYFRIQLITSMRIRILIFILCGSGDPIFYLMRIQVTKMMGI